MKNKVSNRLVLTFFVLSFTIFQSCIKGPDLPTVITTEASNIKSQSAILGGNVTADGGAGIDVCGICLGTLHNPSIENSTVIYCHGNVGLFTCEISFLIPDTYYHVRAFAMSRAGTNYGNEVHFSTNKIYAPAVVTVVIPKFISYYSAYVGIQVTDDGGIPLVEKGICWATSENPTIINDKFINYNTDPDGSGYYSASAFPLMPNTSYHIRAYAINCVGITYGNDRLVTTLAVPEVTTVSASEITNISATVGGNIISFGDAFDIETGICYRTEKDTDINGLRIKTAATRLGEFTCNLKNLEPGTVYYARAYVSWDFEFLIWPGYCVYGNEITFTTMQ